MTGEIVPTGKRGGGRRSGNIPRSAADSQDNEDVCTEAKSSNVSLKDVPLEDLPIPDNLSIEDIWCMYTQCKRELLEVRATLAKAESAFTFLHSQQEETVHDLEQLLKKLKG